MGPLGPSHLLPAFHWLPPSTGQVLHASNVNQVTTVCLAPSWGQCLPCWRSPYLSWVPWEPTFSFFMQKSGELCR
jgi:hypothetical protein